MNKKKLKKIIEKFPYWVGSYNSLVAHTFFFIGIFVLSAFGVSFSNILLILTTVVSLEAIYLAIIIQMTVNRHSEHLEDIADDIDDIQEDVEDLTEE